MRALFVNENIGGHATLHHHLRQTLAEEHPDVVATFYDVPPKGRLRRLLSARIPPLDRADIDLQQIRFQLAQSANVSRAIARLRQPFDVVHFYSQNTALTSIDLLRSVPSVVATDVTSEQHARYLPYRRPTKATDLVTALTGRFEQRVYASATLVVAQSAWVAASLQSSFGVSDDRLRIVTYGLRLPELPPRVGAPDRTRITFVGNPWEAKGGRLLLDVWRDRLRERATLTFVTTDPVPLEPGVEVIDDLRPGDTRLWDLLADTTVFVFPSAVDKSSWAVVEAMAAGVPVVTTDAAALPELVAHGEAGVVVPARDGRALGDAVEGLLRDEGRRRRLGEAGRRRALEHYDARASTAALVEVLHEARERFRGG